MAPYFRQQTLNLSLLHEYYLQSHTQRLRNTLRGRLYNVKFISN